MGSNVSLVGTDGRPIRDVLQTVQTAQSFKPTEQMQSLERDSKQISPERYCQETLEIEAAQQGSPAGADETCIRNEQRREEGISAERKAVFTAFEFTYWLAKNKIAHMTNYESFLTLAQDRFIDTYDSIDSKIRTLQSKGLNLHSAFL